MHKLTIIFLFFLLVPDLYIHLIYIVRRTRNPFLRLLHWMPTILLAGSFLYFFYLGGDNVMAHRAVSIGYIAIGILFFALPKTLFMLISLIGRAIHAAVRRCPTKPFTITAVTVACISGCMVLYGALFGVTQFDVKEVEYRSDRLPEIFDGYRILQVSDLHLGSWIGREEFIYRLVTLINTKQVDLVLITGDLVNQRADELENFKYTLSQIDSADGVYSILGNHDYGDYYHWNSEQEKEENLQDLIYRQRLFGWQVLNNTHVVLRRGNQCIALIGVENDGEPPFSKHSDLPAALRGTKDMFKILMTHNPSHWRREVLPETDIDLTLSGHTHAMQSELFGLSLARLKYPEWGGMYYEGNRALYVNVGIGYIGMPFRFGAWPEVTILTLRK